MKEMKASADILEDERDPDVIPPQGKKTETFDNSSLSSSAAAAVYVRPSKFQTYFI
jgi:hypothetical protein